MRCYVSWRIVKEWRLQGLKYSNPPSGWSAFSKFHCGLPNWDRTNQHQCAKNLSDYNQRNMDTNLHEWFGVSTKNSNVWYRGISVGVGVISLSIPPLLAALTPNNKMQQRDVAADFSSKFINAVVKACCLGWRVQDQRPGCSIEKMLVVVVVVGILCFFVWFCLLVFLLSSTAPKLDGHEDLWEKKCIYVIYICVINVLSERVLWWLSIMLTTWSIRFPVLAYHNPHTTGQYNPLLHI